MREDGFYWVRLGGSWEIVYWSGNRWLSTTGQTYRRDSFWKEIDERRIVREEVK